MVYLAVEHNTKYLAMLAEQAHSERVIAIDKLSKQTQDLKRYKEDNDEMTKKMKILQKDSEALVLQRNQVNKLTTDLITIKESQENLETGYKEASRRLKAADGDVFSLTAARDEYKERSEELEIQLQKCRIDLKEYTHKEHLASDINSELQVSNSKFRALWAEHEEKATDFRAEVSDLKKKLEVMKQGNDRLSEEN